MFFSMEIYSSDNSALAMAGATVSMVCASFSPATQSSTLMLYAMRSGSAAFCNADALLFRPLCRSRYGASCRVLNECRDCSMLYSSRHSSGLTPPPPARKTRTVVSSDVNPSLPDKFAYDHRHFRQKWSSIFSKNLSTSYTFSPSSTS